jgi:hypothetical protein
LPHARVGLYSSKMNAGQKQFSLTGVSLKNQLPISSKNPVGPRDDTGRTSSTERRLLILSLCVVITACAGNHLFGITVTSSEFQTWGDWQEAWVTGGPADGGYSSHSTSDTFWSATFLSISSSPHGWEHASASVDSFSLRMTSSSSPYGMPPYNSSSHININANAVTHFCTESSQLAISLGGYAYWTYLANEQDMQLTLRDLSNSTTLLDLTGLDSVFPGGHFSGEVYNVAVDPSHEYEFTLSGWITSFDAKTVDMGIETQISELAVPGSSVPDSDDTMLLLAASLTALFWAAKRLKRARETRTTARSRDSILYRLTFPESTGARAEPARFARPMFGRTPLRGADYAMVSPHGPKQSKHPIKPSSTRLAVLVGLSSCQWQPLGSN